MASISPSPSVSSSSSSKCSFVSYTDADNLSEQPYQLSPLVTNNHKTDSNSYPILPSKLPGSPSSINDSVDNMSMDELKTHLIATKLKVKDLETSLENYKLLLHNDKDQTREMVEELKAQLGLTERMFDANKYDLHNTCEDLSRQRDQLVNEIQLLSRSHEGATYNAKPTLDRALDTQLQSMQKEISDTRHTIEQLKGIRDGILEEMVLLNTKNAELNTMNNDLSRHIAHRELETKALMATTQFLRPSTSSDTVPIPSPSVSTSTSTSSSSYSHHHHHHHLPPPPLPEHTIHPNPSTSSSTCSSTSSSTKKQTKKQHKQTKKQQQEQQQQQQQQQQQDQSASSTAETKMFPFGRHKNVFANIQPKVLQRKKSNDNNQEQPQPNIKQAIAVPLRYDPKPRLSNEHQQQDQEYQQKQKRFANEESLDEMRSTSHHQFVETKFLRPIKCEWCQEKMWRSNEWKCQACSVVCHVKCAPLMTDQCKNAPTSQTKLPSLSMKQYQQIPCFGRDLVQQAKEEKRTIPFVVQFCVEAVDYRGLDFEGIYRKSGGASQMRLIQQYFDKKQYPNLHDASAWDICAITSVLKHYFRELPNPLFPYEYYESLMQSLGCYDLGDRIKRIGQVIKSMPKENYNTINYLMRHLDRVQQHSQNNLMVTKNLAMVFGPTLIRNIDEMHDITEMNQKIHVIDFILHHINEVFDTSPPSSPLNPVK